MAKSIYTSLLITALVLTGCASNGGSQQAKPDWLEGESARYSRTQYITGRGQADTLAEAENRARANIAKTFQVFVHEESVDTQHATQAVGANGTETTFEAEIQRQINTETDQIISGIEIAETWQDSLTKSYYALAVLPRRQAASKLRREIESMDSATQKYVQLAQKTKDPLAKAGYAAKAWTSQTQRDTVQASLRVIDLTGRGITPKWDAAKLNIDMNELLQRLRIHVDSDDETLLPILSGALAAAGMTPSENDKSDYVLQGELQLTDLGEKDKWQWNRGNLQIKLIEKANQQIRGTKQWQFKAAAADTKTSQNRVYEKADKTLKKELRDVITGFATQ